MQDKKRETNLELLRIIAMLMVISLHYLDKGNTLVEIGKITFKNWNLANELTAWALEVLCYGAVNLYIMISGYFLINARARMEKPFKMVIQVLFYSVGIFLIFLMDFFCIKLIFYIFFIKDKIPAVFFTYHGKKEKSGFFIYHNSVFKRK